jgi:hypothetical protein
MEEAMIRYWRSRKGAKSIAEAIKVNSILEKIDLNSNGIGNEGAKAVAEALKVNSTMQTIKLWYINFGNDLESESQIAEMLKENHSRREMNYRKFICAFTVYQADSVRLRFDKMMLRFVYYPILGFSEC